VSANLYLLNHEDVEHWAPLNTTKGQEFIDHIIERVGGVDFIFFDNIAHLLSGNMREEETWREVAPWLLSLTKRRIGYLWLHHTGHDATHAYGDKSKEWGMDLVGQLVPATEPEAFVHVTLTFDDPNKARMRNPDNYRDFDDVNISLRDDAWHWQKDSVGLVSRCKKLNDGEEKFYKALCTATANSNMQHNGLPATTFNAWFEVAKQRGLFTSDEVRGQRNLLSKYRSELIKKNWIAANDDTIWTIAKNDEAGPF